MAAWLQANAVALLGQFLTLVGLIVGALTVVWQLGRQHKSSLALQREVAFGHFRTNFVIRFLRKEARDNVGIFPKYAEKQVLGLNGYAAVLRY